VFVQDIQKNRLRMKFVFINKTKTKFKYLKIKFNKSDSFDLVRDGTWCDGDLIAREPYRDELQFKNIIKISKSEG
jgi:hypothetical protein